MYLFLYVYLKSTLLILYIKILLLYTCEMYIMQKPYNILNDELALLLLF